MVRSTMSAVCGSDLHLYRQSADRIGDRSNRVAGHEVVGVVEPMFCRDRRTLGNHVDGADAEFVTAPASICLPLPDSLSDEVGALLACNFGTAYSGIRKLRLDGGDVAVVFGLGPVGCCAVVVASSDGADVVAVNPGAQAQGQDAGTGCHRSVDLRSQPAVAQRAHPLRSWVYELGEYEGVVRLAEKRAELLEKLVTRRFAGAEAEEAFDAADKASQGKIVIDWTR